MSNNSSNRSFAQDTINIQVLYNVNQTTEQNAQDRNFHSISLYRSLEHLVSNANNIKKLLHCMTKYILNKKIENSKTNKVKDLKDIGEVKWNFILAIYNSEQNALVITTNNNNISFRCKVIAKFTSKINKVNNSKNKQDKNMDKPTIFNKLLIPILAKLSKKINKISKYFKKNNKPINKPTENQSNGKKDQRKLYVQVLTLVNNTREVLKIKRSKNFSLIYMPKKLKTSKK